VRYGGVGEGEVGVLKAPLTGFAQMRPDLVDVDSPRSHLVGSGKDRKENDLGNRRVERVTLQPPRDVRAAILVVDEDEHPLGGNGQRWP
jgi:hypothetical protein